MSKDRQGHLDDGKEDSRLVLDSRGCNKLGDGKEDTRLVF